MCTVTWLREDHEYQLFFNRDELRTRKPATSPQPQERDGVRFLAPADGDFGGTWIGVNEFGVSVCLLNGANLTHLKGARPQQPRSRGLFVGDLLPSPSVAAVSEQVRETDLSSYAPFTLVAIGPAQPAALIEWNGVQRLVRSEAASQYMLTSSSFDTDAVRTRRREEYACLTNLNGWPTADLLIDFHKNHGKEPSAYSTCMHRPDAHTVSFSRIRVRDREIEFFYTPGAPCEQAASMSQVLLRGTQSPVP